jgi:phage gpG-like protein
MSIQFDVDATSVTAHLSNVDAVVMASVMHAVRIYTADLKNYVQEKKLQGQVLRHVTGKLSASIDFDFPVESEQTIQGRVFSNDTVKYAAIHEFGGVIPAHDVYPKDPDGVLAFMWGGEQRFFKHVHIPDVTMPERSFLRSSLSENAARYERGIMNAAIRAAATGTEDEGIL